MKNKHSVSVPQNVIDETLTSLNAVNDALAPYMHTLTNEERRTIPKMGEKTFSFVTKANELSKQHEELRSNFFTQEDFDIDVSDATQLLAIKDRLSALLSQVEDTIMLAGSEAYAQSLLFYNTTKMGAKSGVPGSREVYDELKNRFPRVRRKSAEEI